jgi:hypothetical protein
VRIIFTELSERLWEFSMNIDIGKRLGHRLQSEIKGRRDFAVLCDTLSAVPKGTLVTLDFRSVETATASWWSAAILPLMRMSANEQTDLYFLIANGLGTEWLDDLRLVAQVNNQPFLVTGQDQREVSIIGLLDDGLCRTLELVQRMKTTTGARLAEACPDEKVGPTAWHNRLRDLYDRRILRRIKRGREQLYSPVIEVTAFDGRELSA